MYGITVSMETINFIMNQRLNTHEGTSGEMQQEPHILSLRLRVLHPVVVAAISFPYDQLCANNYELKCLCRVALVLE